MNPTKGGPAASVYDALWLLKRSRYGDDDEFPTLPEVRVALEAAVPLARDGLREAVENLLRSRRWVGAGFQMSESNWTTLEQALATPEPPDSGDAAAREFVESISHADPLSQSWAEAVAALPLAGWADSDGRLVVPFGTWNIGIGHFPEDGDGYTEPHYPEAFEAIAEVDPHKRVIGHVAESPAAALRNLAAKLRGAAAPAEAREEGPDAEFTRAAMERLRDSVVPDRCPPHLVHPRFASMEVSDVPTDDIARCANLCGWAAYMRPAIHQQDTDRAAR